jgi:hypothetical protein
MIECHAYLCISPSLRVATSGLALEGEVFASCLLAV